MFTGGCPNHPGLWLQQNLELRVRQLHFDLLPASPPGFGPKYSLDQFMRDDARGLEKMLQALLAAASNSSFTKNETSGRLCTVAWKSLRVSRIPNWCWRRFIGNAAIANPRCLPCAVSERTSGCAGGGHGPPGDRRTRREVRSRTLDVPVRCTTVSGNPIIGSFFLTYCRRPDSYGGRCGLARSP